MLRADVYVGLTVKYDFNCILIDKAGIHHVNLNSADPIGEMESAEGGAKVDVPAPPLDVGVGAIVA